MNKIFSLKNLANISKSLKKEGKKIVLCHGVSIYYILDILSI